MKKTINLVSLITAIILKGKKCNTDTDIANLVINGAKKINELYSKKSDDITTPAGLVLKVGVYFNLEKPLTVTNTRKEHYPMARRIACKLLKDNFYLSHKEISVLLLYKSGYCIKNTMSEINKALLYDAKFKMAYEEIKVIYNLR